MAIAAPITLVVGVVMAVRQDVGLSAILARGDPGRRRRARLDRRRAWCRRSSGCRSCIDQINRVLREQITGIRVVRAFVREPEETAPLRGRPTPT